MKLDDLVLETNKEEIQCKGRVYRFTLNQFYSTHQSIEVRKSLRLLKKESCPGCEKCGWIDEFLEEDVHEVVSEYLSDMKDGQKYELVPIGGRGYLPEDDWVEITFKEVD